jgi:anti-sigma regulatory factor (Ser/Thr protein kinase)
VRQHLHRNAVDDAAIYAIDFTLEELAGNTLRYGYETGGEGVIRVEIALAPSLVQLAITDDARPFDPTLHPEPSRPRTLGDAPIGGHGISMVRRLVRAMRYRHEAGRNRLEVDVARATSA